MESNNSMQKIGYNNINEKEIEDFGSLSFKILETKNMKKIEKISKANYQITVVHDDERNIIFKKIPIKQDSNIINIPENSIIEIQFNVPRKIPLLTITDNIGIVKIHLRELILKSKVNDEPKNTVESWFILQDTPNKENKSIIPQIKIRFQYEKKSMMKQEDFDWLKLLGRGKFGKVWQVRYKSTKKLYAIKAIRKQNLTSNDRDLKNAFVEKLILSHIAHPFIIGLQFAFQCESKLYLGLDYVAGGDMHYHMYTLKKIYKNEDLVHFYACQIYLAIEHLHASNIVLRDLKPENILIGIDGYILITDFGLSKVLETKKNTFSIVGTLEYIAPEMLKNHRTSGYNNEVDWWSFGILMYEIFYNALPFQAKTQNELFDYILHADPFFDGSMGSSLVEVIWGLLNKNPKLRYTELDIKSSKFFSSTNWDKFIKKEIEPPYKPKLKKEGDTKYFGKEYTNQNVKDSVELKWISPMSQKKFDDFAFTNNQIFF